MRFYYLIFYVFFVSCIQKQSPSSSSKPVEVDTLIQKTPLKIPDSSEELNWSNLLALMESLHETPSDQRSITLKNIKVEAIKLNTQLWPKNWDTKPIRSRFNIFLTHACLAADQLYGENIMYKQSNAINQMKISWDFFANKLKKITFNNLQLYN